MKQYESTVVQTAQQYYNSDDADLFYFTIWGGEDIHVGLYETDTEPIPDASHRTVANMAKRLEPLDPGQRVIDVGAGYGGAARYLARGYGCHVVALNLSEVENQRDRKMNVEQGLDGLIDVLDASFDAIPYDEASFDAAWSQDAFLHSDDRAKVIAEVARVLKPGGRFVFTDPMQADDADTRQLQPIYDRIHLDSLGSPGFYKEVGRQSGLQLISFENHTHQLTRHYSRVRDELTRREREVRAAGVSDAYIERMNKGLRHWIDGGKSGQMAWGIFEFRKRND
jgi:sarcosine/dimethylglycine N-methyltransferase